MNLGYTRLCCTIFYLTRQKALPIIYPYKQLFNDDRLRWVFLTFFLLGLEYSAVKINNFTDIAYNEKAMEDRENIYYGARQRRLRKQRQIIQNNMIKFNKRNVLLNRVLELNVFKRRQIILSQFFCPCWFIPFNYVILFCLKSTGN